MSAFLPRARYIDLGPDGGPYDDTRKPKVCWHTTEGGSLAGAEAAFRAFPPHLGYDPRIRDLRQYVRLDRHSFSLRGAESDDEYIIQIEVVGRAAETPDWPDQWYRNIGEDLVRPLRELLGVPDQHQRFYGPNEGIVLASRHSPIRLSDSALRAFSGHMGHQHAPDPDEHWDPGGFLIDKAIDYSRQTAPDAPGEDDDMGMNVRLFPATDPANPGREYLALSDLAKDPGSRVWTHTGHGNEVKLRVWFEAPGHNKYLGPKAGEGHLYTLKPDTPDYFAIPDGCIAMSFEWTTTKNLPASLAVKFVPKGA